QGGSGRGVEGRFGAESRAVDRASDGVLGGTAVDRGGRARADRGQCHARPPRQGDRSARCRVHLAGRARPVGPRRAGAITALRNGRLPPIARRQPTKNNASPRTEEGSMLEILRRLATATGRWHGGMKDTADTVGEFLVDAFHYLALFAIGGTTVWSAAAAFIGMAAQGRASLGDILLLFIYLEIGAMVGIYF